MSDYSDAVLADGPLAYYRLAETAGPTATDEMGNYDGIYGSSVAFSQVPAKQIDGTSITDANSAGGTVAIPANAIALPAGSYGFTIEAWVNVAGTATKPILGGRKTATANTVLDFCIGSNGVSGGSGELTALVRDDGKSGLSSLLTGVIINDGLWHHTALVLTDTDLTIYLDGASIASQSHSMVNALTPDNSYFGREARNGWLFTGGMDELAIYSKALTALEILNHYDAAAGVVLPQDLKTINGLALSTFQLFPLENYQQKRKSLEPDSTIVDILYGGLATITGTVQINGTPGVRRVLALDTKTHIVRAETWSDENGNFMLERLKPGEKYLVLADDYTLEYNDVVAARIEATIQ